MAQVYKESFFRNKTGIATILVHSETISAEMCYLCRRTRYYGGP